MISLCFDTHALGKKSCDHWLVIINFFLSQECITGQLLAKNWTSECDIPWDFPPLSSKIYGKCSLDEYIMKASWMGYAATLYAEKSFAEYKACPGKSLLLIKHYEQTLLLRRFYFQTSVLELGLSWWKIHTRWKRTAPTNFWANISRSIGTCLSITCKQRWSSSFSLQTWRRQLSPIWLMR